MSKISRSDAKAIHSRGITVLKPGHREIRKLRRDAAPAIHGDKVWNSSWLLMDELRRRGLPGKARLMDIGCGWGPLSVYAAKRLGVRVTAVDADREVLPFLALHAEINQVKIDTLTCRFEKLKKKQLQPFHTLAGADICFWDELTPVLYALIRRALKAGVKQIIIADPGRDPFYQLAEKCAAKFSARIVERRTSTPKTILADLVIIDGH